MKKKNGYSKNQIIKIKNHISRTFPHASKVDVRVRKLTNGNYKSSIKVIASQKRELIAQKIDEDASKSLERSHSAIISQIHRIKTKWDKTKLKTPKALITTNSPDLSSGVYL